jgi:hypothetical protein
MASRARTVDMKQSPTTLSLKELRKDPRFTLIQVTEHWDAFARIRKDLFEVIDIVALGPGITLGVQTTAYGSMSARLKKLREHANTPLILEAGWLIEVHGWTQNDRGRYELKRRIKFELEDPVSDQQQGAPDGTTQ